MCKINLKDAYFAVPLVKGSRKCVKFRWKDSLSDFLCLFLGFLHPQEYLQKLLKVLISLLRKLCLRIIIPLGHVLLMGTSREELLASHDTLICLLSSLVFLIIIQKSILNPNWFSNSNRFQWTSQGMTLSLTIKKERKIQEQCKKIRSQ